MQRPATPDRKDIPVSQEHHTQANPFEQAAPQMSHVQAIKEPPTGAKRIALLVVLLLVLGLGGAIAAALSSATAEQARLETERTATAAAANAAADCEVVHPVPAEMTPLVVLTGVLAPAEAADLGFEVPGRISRVDVQLGDHVTAGQTLATLDRSSVGAQANASEAAIGVAQANVSMLRERVDLVRTLVASGAAPERDLSGATQQLAIAEAQVRQAEAGRRAVSTSAADHALRAPFDGVVTRVPSGVGQVVGPGAPVFRVENLSVLELRTTVSETELEALRTGMTAFLEGSNAPGVISATVRSLETGSRRAPVEVRVPNPDGRLVANALVRARVAVGQPIPALRIPPSARRGDGRVFVVTAGGIIEERQLEAQGDIDGSWLVAVGLTPADQVVVRAATAREGGIVSPRLRAEPGAPSAPAAAPAAQ
jgi:RND family efflux transporter MFP subunit